jgi:phage-related baseplate assembly protein
MPTPPEFISNIPQTVIDDTVAYYESLTGNTLQPAQVERLILLTVSYRETLLRGRIQAAGEQNLISFSTAPVIDYLVEILGVQRTQATDSLVTIQFTLVSGHGGVTIPSGTRVASTDGQAVFETQSDIVVPAVDLTATHVCRSVTPGANFNGYAIGLITNILDPQAYLESATNLDVSAGGADAETDDQLRERARLAPDAFGTAGATNAYIYWALTVNPDLIDVNVDIVPNTPGTVIIYPLLEDGSVTPTAVLDQVYAICNSDDVRPLTDTVVVTAPTQVPYTLDIELTIYESADATDVQAAAQTAVDAYVLQQRQTMGRDIMSDQVIATCMVDGVYEADLGAFTDIIIASNEYGYCTSATVTVVGTNEG